jgi:hypothetical protein
LPETGNAPAACDGAANASEAMEAESEMIQSRSGLEGIDVDSHIALASVMLFSTLQKNKPKSKFCHRNLQYCIELKILPKMIQNQTYLLMNAAVWK